MPDELDSLRAAARLSRSATAWKLGALLLSAVALPVAGWAAAKLDTQRDLVALRSELGAVMNGQRALIARLDELVGKDGQLAAVRDEQRAQRRSLLVLEAAMRSYERPERWSRKLAAGESLGRVFDGLLGRGLSAEQASNDALGKVALP